MRAGSASPGLTNGATKEPSPGIVDVSMSKVTLVVPDPPPTRTHPGRSADRNSPNAQDLARAALVASGPPAFPLTFAGLTLVFGRTIPDVDPLGYQPQDPIIEVLAEVGAVRDPEAYWSSFSQDASADFYVVTFETEPDAQ
jgi:hypothetical protein